MASKGQGSAFAGGRAALGALPLALALLLLPRGLAAGEGLKADGTWMVIHDDNHLGTSVLPDPYAPSPESPPEGGKGCARLHGRLGLNQAPWTWAQLRQGISASGRPVDLTRFHSVSFWAKGDGSIKLFRLQKQSITDSDHFGMSFPTSREWKLVKLPLDAFRQAGWGKKADQVFDDVTGVDFSPVAHDASFDFSVAGVAFSEESVELKPQPYASGDWWAYSGVDPAAREGSPLDMGFLQDAPAGHRGRVRALGEDFGFADGSRIRFFGVNLVASTNFPTHAQADAMAELLSEMGVNLTRHHHMEATWTDRNVFGNAAGTRDLDKESMDRFDYLVAALQKKGIYQYFDMLVSRAPLAADGVADPSNLADGWKVKAEFAPDLLKLEKEFISQFLGHRNPYTGRRYADDPGVAMMEVVNEDSLFYRSADGDFSLKGEVYPREFQERFNAWLRAHYRDREALARSWAPGDTGKRGLGDDEDPKASTVRPLPSWQDEGWKGLTPARAADEARFNYDTQLGYYKEIEDHLRRVGYKGLVAGSNHWTTSPADLLANAELGTYIDRHAYYAHPQGGWGYSPEVHYEPAPMLRNEGLGIVSELASRRVKGQPFIATEWQCAAPNDYRADAVLDMALACSLQGWSAIQFAFRHSSQEDLLGFAGPLDNNFDVANQPAMLALWPAAAVLARRGDLGRLKAQAWNYLEPAAALKPGAALADPGRMALMAECGVAFGSPPSAAPALPQADAQGWTAENEGGASVRHDPEGGVLTVDSPGTQAVAGFGKRARLSRLSVDVDNAYCVVAATALDTADLGTAKRVLITAVANAINEGMTLTPSGDQIVDKGGPRVLVEPVRGDLTLSFPSPASLVGARAWALDPSGRRRKAVALGADGKVLSLTLKASDEAMNYELDLPSAPGR